MQTANGANIQTQKHVTSKNLPAGRFDTPDEVARCRRARCSTRARDRPPLSHHQNGPIFQRKKARNDGSTEAAAQEERQLLEERYQGGCGRREIGRDGVSARDARRMRCAGLGGRRTKHFFDDPASTGRPCPPVLLNWASMLVVCQMDLFAHRQSNDVYRRSSGIFRTEHKIYPYVFC